jgi:type III secretion protein C
MVNAFVSARKNTQRIWCNKRINTSLLNRLRQMVSSFLLACVIVYPLYANAADIEWKKRIDPLKYADRPVVEVLLGILTANGVTANISENVKGTVSVRVGSNESQRVFENLCRANGLIWFYDGQVVNVVSSSEQVTKIITVNPLEVAAVNSALQASGLRSKRLPFKYVPESSSFIFTGPNRYVNLVEEVIQGAVKRQLKGNKDRLDPSGGVTQVFRLQFAWADDLTIQSDSGVSKIPGIASVLRAQFGRTSAAASMAGGALAPISSVAGEGGRSVVESKTLDAEGNTINNADSVFPSLQSGGFNDLTRFSDNVGISPRIASDPRTNSVIITDVASRMPQYAKTIKELDVKSPIVEIEVAIVELEAGTGQDIGMNWQFDKVRPRDSPSAQPNPLNQVTYDAGQLMMRLTKNGLDAFMANLTLLSAQGKARIVQRPRVITVDNFEAMIGTSDKAFVRVAGRDAVALYPVSTGLSLRVRPRVLGMFEEGGQPHSLMLHVNIEDGRNTGNQVDGIPTQKRNLISTQTIVKPLESVVLGGQILETESDSDSGVPFFKDIPILGHAFKSTATSRKSVERLFIISPRVINQSSETLTRAEMPAMAPGVRAPVALQPSASATYNSKASSPAAVVPRVKNEEVIEKYGSGK